LLAEHTVALQRQGLQRVQDAAIALTVDVLDRELISLELIKALLRVGARLRHVEAEDDLAVAGIVTEILRPRALGENVRRCERYQASARSLQDTTPVHTKLRHVSPPQNIVCLRAGD